MTISVGELQALTVKGIEAKGGVRDAIFKNHAYLNRLKGKQGIYSGEKMTFPFVYKDDTESTGKFYQGSEALGLNYYDPMTELSFELVEIVESLLITHADLAKNSGKEGRLKLLAEKLKIAEKAMRQRFTKGIYSDGTASTGALSTKQFAGMKAFLKDAAVNYGGITNTDVSTHVAFINDNSGSDRALTTALIQATIGGASEGMEMPTLGIMRQNVMNEFIELIQPYQRTTRENSLDNFGHAGNTLVFNGIDHIVDNLCEAQAISYINEKHVRLYSHPEYDMKRVEKENLENSDAMLNRIFWKGVYVCDTLRFQGQLQDIQVA